ncbi:MAG: threonine--tRNA ligase [Gammaproteobacteria bacterium]
MPAITLPDGSQKKFDHPVTVAEVAASIGPGLAKAALAGKLDDKLVDVSHTISHDAKLSIITERDADGLEVIRHSSAHLLAQAVKQLFPEAQVTIGPVIEDGFYYDFAYKRPFTQEDLAAIEKRMEELAAKDQPVSRSVMPRDEAVKFFRGMGEKYKAEIIASIPADQEISLYRQGDFIDLCRGPHVPSTGKLKAFHLTKLAGAYWRGDSKNEMLQRIYGTAWRDKKSLQAYLTRLEEAEKRDHRRLGRELDLFHMQEEAPGLVFWHARGWAVWQVVEQYMRTVYQHSGYQEIRCPQILDKSLWEKTGHWQNYRESMFTTSSENRDYAIKPMNCPGHVLTYNHGLHSYRELPIRYGEFGSCTRNEPSGALHGLMRVRGFVQDDGHIFCTEDQIESEVIAFHHQAMQVYADFGFNDIGLKLALRPSLDKRIGSDAVWDKSEAALRRALGACGVQWQELAGEGAFYGPKIEYHLQDSIGRSWQVGTMQVDFSMPGRLGAEYVGEDGAKHVPVMLHRAIVGSMERFLGILIEHHAGRFPAWLAPLQAMALTITDRQDDYALKVTETLKNQGLRVDSDLRNEKIGYKIREHTLQRVPYLLVVGDKEQQTGSVAVRTRNGKDLGSLTIEAFAQQLAAEINRRGVSA